MTDKFDETLAKLAECNRLVEGISDASTGFAAEQRSHGRKLRLILHTASVAMLVGAAVYVWASLP